MQARETAEILAYLSAAFPRHELPPETVKVWVDQLAGVDFAIAQAAAKAAVASSEWFPTVHRFRELVAAERRQHGTDPGCAACDRGFILYPNGSVGFCSSCRPTPRTLTSRPVRELEPKSSDWTRWVQEARAFLDSPVGITS
jgi:hypothetical protein